MVARSTLPLLLSLCIAPHALGFVAPVRQHLSWAPAVRNVRPMLRMGWGDPVDFSTAKVVGNTEAAEGTRSITVDCGTELLAPYTKAGMFCQIKESEDAKAGFYAIASSPPDSSKGVCEFLIKETDSNTWLCTAEAGASVMMSAAMGSGFRIDEKFSDDVKNILLFAAGSGISPIKSAIESGSLGLSDSTTCTLYYGAKSPDLMAYMDKFAAWEEAGVKVVPVMSAAKDWDGRTGYVQAALKEDGVKLSKNTGALICGMKEMAEDVKAELADAGVDSERVLLNF